MKIINIKQLQLNASETQNHRQILFVRGLLGVKHYLLKTWFTKWIWIDFNYVRVTLNWTVHCYTKEWGNHSANWISEFLNFYLNNSSDQYWMKTCNHTENFSFFQFFNENVHWSNNVFCSSLISLHWIAWNNKLLNYYCFKIPISFSSLRNIATN